MFSQQLNLDNISHNLANVNTSGYKKNKLEFQDLLYQTIRAPGAPTGATTESPVGVQKGSGVRLVGTVSIQEQGTYLATDNPLDVAIEGAGYFTVETPAGPRLTRAGAFAVNDAGVIATAQGYAVGGEGGAPIALPPGAGRIVISADGVVSADGAQVGRLELVDAPPTALVREGDNLFRATGETTAIDQPKLRQGHLEGSNVNAVLEISRLIEVQRAFEMGQQMMNEETERQRRAIETLGGNR